MNNKKLINKNIVISAAAEGIGWAIAQKCLENGATVFISDKNEEAINKINNHKLYKKCHTGQPDKIILSERKF